MQVKENVRHHDVFIVQPTSEEVITDIARQEIRSYRQMPKNFYHIQTKFRDERRPRFGVMRGREFTMKDAYSFDRDWDGLKKSYQSMYDAYVKIFERMGLDSLADLPTLSEFVPEPGVVEALERGLRLRQEEQVAAEPAADSATTDA